MVTMDSVEKRLAAVEERRQARGNACTFCEQLYWTSRAWGYYQCEEMPTLRGACAQHFAKIIAEANAGVSEEELSTFERGRADVEEALYSLEESRPRAPGCEYCALWPVLVNLISGVALDHEEAAGAILEAIEELKRRPLATKMLYFNRTLHPEGGLRYLWGWG